MEAARLAINDVMTFSIRCWMVISNSDWMEWISSLISVCPDLISSIISFDLCPSSPPSWPAFLS
jgi:hypothetical protein